MKSLKEKLQVKKLMLTTVAGLLFLFSFRSANVEISGTVTDLNSGAAIEGVVVKVMNFNIQTTTNAQGNYKIAVPANASHLEFAYPGYALKQVKIAGRQILNVELVSQVMELKEEAISLSDQSEGVIYQSNKRLLTQSMPSTMGYYQLNSGAPVDNQTMHNTEEYADIQENIFHSPLNAPLSTFSIDVDAASYSNIRRFINYGQIPPKDAVRIEEMVNYFNYDYPQPKGKHPFSIYSEISECPWNSKHQLVHIGLQGKNIDRSQLPASNLVFLLDVSGSMNSPEKLPLLKSAFQMLVNQMNENDRVAIVVYAGAAGVVLPSTSGDEKSKILEAIQNLSAGGSTAGGAGINLAYKIAAENFIAEGNNRIILATDGDFNVGVSSEGSLEDLVAEKRKTGVYLTVLGFGMGNYKDNKMEILADKGNGNYAYIDNISEAKKVVVNEMAGTLFTIAKDVKIQVEFNPAQVQAYRLIGYENRKLNDEDFNDDKKDAGELGVGHTVTALYEIIPTGVESDFIKSVDNLKYQQAKNKDNKNTKELLNLKLRYKQPDGLASELIEQPLMQPEESLDNSSENFRFSAAVAAFGMLLRESEFSNGYTFAEAYTMAKSATGKDQHGYRAEFLKMVESCQLMASNKE